jgi:transposase
MRKDRRTFTGAFKAKVALEALQERKTINQLAQEHDLHPNQISSWKKELLTGSAKIFETPNRNAEDEREKTEAKLYQQIGQLKVENDWLKKNSEQFLGLKFT